MRTFTFPASCFISKTISLRLECVCVCGEKREERKNDAVSSLPAMEDETFKEFPRFGREGEEGRNRETGGEAAQNTAVVHTLVLSQGCLYLQRGKRGKGVWGEKRKRI
jgi:hypothetical protein